MWESGCLIVDDIGLTAYGRLLGSVTDSWADISKSKHRWSTGGGGAFFVWGWRGDRRIQKSKKVRLADQISV